MLPSRTNTIRYAVLLHILINAFGSTIVPFIVRNGNRFQVMLLGSWVLASIIIGVVFFIVFVAVKKKVTFEPGEVYVPKNLYIFLMWFDSIYYNLPCNGGDCNICMIIDGCIVDY